MGRRDQLAAKVVFAAMEELDRAGGTADIETLRTRIEESLQLDAWDTTLLPRRT